METNVDFLTMKKYQGFVYTQTEKSYHYEYIQFTYRGFGKESTGSQEQRTDVALVHTFKFAHKH